MPLIKKGGVKIASVNDLDAYFKEEGITDRSAYEIIFSNKEKKAIYKQALKTVRVEVDHTEEDGSISKLVFDADKESRDLMSQAIEASSTLNVDQANWKMADNTWKLVNLADLKNAIAQGIKKHGDILRQYS
jgi:hypothetical protein